MKTIAIISQKGGAGKTTIAVHLAVAAERKGLTTALFDLDPQASAANWSDKRKKLYKDTPAEHTPAVESVQATRLKGLLAQAAAQHADLAIIDSAPNADAAAMAAAKEADLILIPCRPSAFDMDAIGTTLNLAAVAGKPAYVLLNAVAPRRKADDEARQALSKDGVQVVGPVLHHLVAYSHAVNDGRTAQELDEKSKAAAEIEALFAWVFKQTNTQTNLSTNSQARKRAG